MTYNDFPGGIFSSQVIDVVKFLNIELKSHVKLVVIISIRNYLSHRKKIKCEYPQAIVIAGFPGVHRWRLNTFFLHCLTFFYKPKTIIGRSVLATQLALILKQKNKHIKVVYDGRAALKAECVEYNVFGDLEIAQDIPELERQCVLQSDYRISISNQLVNYWKNEFGYSEKKHTVIPCTLNSLYENIVITNDNIKQSRDLLRYKTEDVVFVYSGSSSRWQLTATMFDFIMEVLKQNTINKMLFLSNTNNLIKNLQLQFPNQVQCLKVLPHEVPQYLLACDYGLLLREQTITNQVASPVKFAEYLACGLDIIISDNLGDYSEFVKKYDCGVIFNETFISKKISLENKTINQQLARQYFTKGFYKAHYSNFI